MTPNPGSDEALALGCKCPVIDNEYGKGVPWPRTDGLDPNGHPSFWISQDCPLHGPSLDWSWVHKQEVADALAHEEGSCNCPACSGDWDFVNQCERGATSESGTAEAGAPCE